MTDVFISYSRKDQAFVEVLHDALKASNMETWVDWENIPKGTEWWKQIEAGIEGSDTFIFVISPDSIVSKVCGDEINHAIKNGKRFLPIVRKDVNPEKFEDINPSHQSLKKHNWLLFRATDDFESAFKELMKTLDTDIEYVQQHTEILRETLKWETNQRNDSFLLRGEELKKAETWLENAEQRLQEAKNQSDTGKKKDPNPLLVEQQRNFILKSRENEDAHKKADLILREAKEKADKLIKVGLGIFIVTIIGAVIAGIYAWRELVKTRLLQKATEAQVTITESRVAQLDRKASFDSLILALKAGQKISNLRSENNQKIQEISLQAKAALQQALMDVKERNRFTDSQQGVRSIALSTDGKILASGTKDGTIKIWDLGTGKERDPLQGHQDSVTSVALSKDGKILASGTEDGTIKIWDLGTREKRAPLPTLMTQGCEWLEIYINTHREEEKDLAEICGKYAKKTTSSPTF